MVAIILGLVAVLVVLAFLMQFFAKKRRIDFVPSSAAMNDPDTNSLRVDMEPIATPDEQTVEILEREQAYDASDDLLDPKNPHHSEWIHEHPGLESDSERAADQADGEEH